MLVFNKNDNVRYKTKCLQRKCRFRTTFSHSAVGISGEFARPSPTLSRYLGLFGSLFHGSVGVFGVVGGKVRILVNENWLKHKIGSKE